MEIGMSAIIWPCSSPIEWLSNGGYITLNRRRDIYIILESSYHKEVVEDHVMIWTAQFCPFAEVSVVFNSFGRETRTFELI
ncbi:hypothetical protein CFP56_020489 [Quercus suber]|uniref:Uncharacterized protein n=1 Tax=Quercus suber TaxID=58331 RepID=A0AAW0LZ80_QUESU